MYGTTLWQTPLYKQNCQKGKVTTQTTPQKISITQRMRNDLGRSVEVNTVTQPLWLTGLRTQPSHSPQQSCNKKDTHLKCVNKLPFIKYYVPVDNKVKKAIFSVKVTVKVRRSSNPLSWFRPPFRRACICSECWGRFSRLYTDLMTVPNLTFTELRGFHGAFATGVASQQGALTLPDTWFRPPFWDLLMLQLLRPNSSNLPCLYSTFHLEYPLVLSRFCFLI